MVNTSRYKVGDYVKILTTGYSWDDANRKKGIFTIGKIIGIGRVKGKPTLIYRIKILNGDKYTNYSAHKDSTWEYFRREIVYISHLEVLAELI